MNLNCIASKPSPWLPVLLALCCSLLRLGAQTRSGLLLSPGPPGVVDPAFDPGSGANGPVYSVVLQTDGRVLIGGEFTQVNGLARARIARLNIDGSLDRTFDPGSGADATVEAILAQADGKVIIGGFFTAVGGTKRAGVARLNSDGSVDTAFNPGAVAGGFSPGIISLALQKDRKVLIGGRFSSVGGVNRASVARLNSDGTLDSSFNLGAGVDSPVLFSAVNSILPDADGRTLIGGLFTSVNRVANDGIARLNSDGSLDASFHSVALQIEKNIPGINAVVMQTDGKILIGGRFEKVNGIGRTNIARLNMDGTLDASFNAGIGPDQDIKTIAIQADGKVVIGGYFQYIGATKRIVSGPFGIPSEVIEGGTKRSGIARLNNDGTLDASFDPGSGVQGTDALPALLSMALQNDEKVIIGGDFTKYNGTPRRSVGRILLGSPVSLVIGQSGNKITLSWPTAAASFLLEETVTLTPGITWAKVAATPTTLRDQSLVTVNATDREKYYRLRKQ